MMMKNQLINYYNITACLLIASTFTACKNDNKGKKAPEKSNVHHQNYKPQKLQDTVGGIYHEYYKNGNVKLKGVFKNGKRDGDWSYFYENGKLWSRGEYNEGIRNGLSNVYYENGVLRMEGNYRNNKRVGPWKFYDQNGKLLKELDFK